VLGDRRADRCQSIGVSRSVSVDGAWRLGAWRSALQIGVSAIWVVALPRLGIVLLASLGSPSWLCRLGCRSRPCGSDLALTVAPPFFPACDAFSVLKRCARPSAWAVCPPCEQTARRVSGSIIAKPRRCFGLTAWRFQRWWWRSGLVTLAWCLPLRIWVALAW
jgi:hypothetical protein